MSHAKRAGGRVNGCVVVRLVTGIWDKEMKGADVRQKLVRTLVYF